MAHRWTWNQQMRRYASDRAARASANRACANHARAISASERRPRRVHRGHRKTNSTKTNSTSSSAHHSRPRSMSNSRKRRRRACGLANRAKIADRANHAKIADRANRAKIADRANRAKIADRANHATGVGQAIVRNARQAGEAAARIGAVAVEDADGATARRAPSSNSIRRPEASRNRSWRAEPRPRTRPWGVAGLRMAP